MTTAQNQTKKEVKKTKWSYVLLWALAAIVAIEGGVIYYQATQKDKGIENMESIAKTQYATPFLGRASGWPDPFGGDPFAALAQMQNRINRFASKTFSEPLIGNFMPTIDLEETEQAYIVSADLPGLKRDKIDITVQNNLLTIRGVRESRSESRDEKSGYYAQERSYGSFARTIALPGPVDEANIRAQYQEGVLTITLPKVETQESSQKIEIE